MDALSSGRSRTALGRRALGIIAAFVLLLTVSFSAAAQTLDRIKQSGKITLGYGADTRPFSFQDAAGKPTGYAVELCGRIAEAIKENLGAPSLEVVYVPVPRGEGIRAISQGRIDLLCDPEVPTVTSRNAVSYSMPIFASGIGVMVHQGASDRLKSALAGREAATRPQWRANAYQLLQQNTLAVVKGSPAEQILLERLKELQLNAKIVPVSDLATGVADVAARRADAFFADRAILLDQTKHSSFGPQLQVLDRYFTHQSAALSLSRNDEDFRLFVDRALSRLLASGEWRTIYSSWFGPPNELMITFFQLNALRE